MRALALLSSVVFAALLAASLSGHPPRLARARPGRRGHAAQTWLLQAGTPVTPAQLAAASLLIAVVVLVLLTALTRTPAIAVLPAVIGGLGPRLWLARERARRLAAVREAWPDGLRVLIAAVTAGRSLRAALLELADSGPLALRGPFTRFRGLVRAIGVPAALEVVRGELADPTSDRVVEVLLVAHEQGGPVVVEVLRDLAEATTADVRASHAAATQALEGALNARIVFVLPWAALALLCARPGPFRDFYAGSAGLLVIALGALLSLLGLWWVGRLARPLPEPRVLDRGEGLA